MITFETVDEATGLIAALRLRIEHISGVQTIPGDKEYCLILTDLRNWKVLCHPDEAAKLIEAADRQLRSIHQPAVRLREGF